MISVLGRSHLGQRIAVFFQLNDLVFQHRDLHLKFLNIKLSGERIDAHLYIDTFYGHLKLIPIKGANNDIRLYAAITKDEKMSYVWLGMANLYLEFFHAQHFPFHMV